MEREPFRRANADDVPRIVALLNAAFAMERAFVDRDRTNVAEITHYLGLGTFFAVDGEDEALASCRIPRMERSWGMSAA